MKKKLAASKPQKANPLDSPQWASESTLTADASPPFGSGSGSWSGSGSGSSGGPGILTLTVTRSILCCGWGQIISASATAKHPKIKKPPVQLACPDGLFFGHGGVSHEYPVKPADCGTVLTFTASGVERVLTVKVPVMKFTTETVALVPADRGRRKLGVGEEVKITVTPGIGTVTWEPPTRGILNPLIGHVVQYTAPDNTVGGVIETVTLRATLKTTKEETIVAKEITCDLIFEIKEPTDILMTKFPGSSLYHEAGHASGGYCAKVHILPEDVCFYKVKVLEDTCPAIGTGWYAFKNNQPTKAHPRWATAYQVNQDLPDHPSLMEKFDAVWANDPPDPLFPWADGEFIWNIPWLFICGAALEKQFTVAQHKVVLTPTGKVRLTKKQMDVELELNAPNSNLDCC
jgi:hypothetical protein